MTIEKQTVIDKIEVIENGVIQIRQNARIVEDGKIIAESYARWTCAPGQDVSDQDIRIQDIAKVIWTPEVIASYEASTVMPVAGE